MAAQSCPLRTSPSSPPSSASIANNHSFGNPNLTNIRDTTLGTLVAPDFRYDCRCSLGIIVQVDSFADPVFVVPKIAILKLTSAFESRPAILANDLVNQCIV